MVVVPSRSKSRQKSKNLKGLKSLQRPSVWRNVYQSTNLLSIWYLELELPLELWQFFRLLLLGPGALSISFSNWLPTRQSEWSCWCFVAFFPKGTKKIFEPRTFEFFTSCNQWSFCTKVCLQNIRFPSATSALGYTPSTLASKRLENLLCMSFFYYFNFGNILQKKISKPRIKAEMLNGWEDVKGIIKACFMFLQIIKIKLPSHFGIKKLLKARC